MSQDPAGQEEHEQPEKLDDEQKGWIPRPPRIESAADFVVIVFACTVAFILVALAIGIIIAGISGAAIAPYFAVLTDIMTTLIGSLIGYLAGRGVSKGQNGGT